MEYRPLRPTLHTIKNTIFHTFLPPKSEEDYHNYITTLPQPQAQPVRWINKSVIQIRDVYAYQTARWNIHKILTHQEIQSRKLLLSHDQVFDHVFRHWTVDDTAELAELGIGYEKAILDVTDEDSLMAVHRYAGKMYLRPDENYELGFTDLIQFRSIRPMDEIGLSWSIIYNGFVFKLLRPSVVHP